MGLLLLESKMRNCLGIIIKHLKRLRERLKGYNNNPPWLSLYQREGNVVNWLSVSKGRVKNNYRTYIPGML
jgi:hypothetical protein